MPDQRTASAAAAAHAEWGRGGPVVTAGTHAQHRLQQHPLQESDFEGTFFGVELIPQQGFEGS